MARKRTPSKPATKKTSDDIRELAGQLDAMSRKLHLHADTMDNLHVQDISPLMGNFDIAVKYISGFISKQIVPKIVAAAEDLGVEFQVKISQQKK